MGLGQTILPVDDQRTQQDLHGEGEAKQLQIGDFASAMISTTTMIRRRIRLCNVKLGGEIGIGIEIEIDISVLDWLDEGYDDEREARNGHRKVLDSSFAHSPSSLQEKRLTSDDLHSIYPSYRLARELRSPIQSDQSSSHPFLFVSPSPYSLQVCCSWAIGLFLIPISRPSGIIELRGGDLEV